MLNSLRSTARLWWQCHPTTIISSATVSREHKISSQPNEIHSTKNEFYIFIIISWTKWKKKKNNNNSTINRTQCIYIFNRIIGTLGLHQQPNKNEKAKKKKRKIIIWKHSFFYQWVKKQEEKGANSNGNINNQINRLYAYFIQWIMNTLSAPPLPIYV